MPGSLRRRWLSGAARLVPRQSAAASPVRCAGRPGGRWPGGRCPDNSRAPRLIPHMAEHRADMRAGLRHGAVPAPEQRSAPAGPASDGTTRRSTQSPGFPSSASEHAAWPADAAAGSGSDHQDGHSVSHLQIRQQSLAEMALREGRVVTRRQSHRTDEAGVCPGNRLANASSARGFGCPASSPSPGEHARSEHAYGGPSGRRCGTFLLYSAPRPLVPARARPMRRRGRELLTPGCCPTPVLP